MLSYVAQTGVETLLWEVSDKISATNSLLFKRLYGFNLNDPRICFTLSIKSYVGQEIAFSRRISEK